VKFEVARREDIQSGARCCEAYIFLEHDMCTIIAKGF
jgi:hypothetical protein